MFSYNNDGLFEYVPLSVDCITENSFVGLRFGELNLSVNTIERMKSLCTKQGPPIVFDFSGLNILSHRVFVDFFDSTIKRDVYLVSVSAYCRSRIVDDTGSVLLKYFEGSDSDCFFFSNNGQPNEDIKKIEFNGDSLIHKNYFSEVVKEEALKDHPGDVPFGSTPVYSEKYFNAKSIYIYQPDFNVFVDSMVRAINSADFDSFDMIVSSSYGGSFFAGPVAHLLGVPMHCFIDIGPKVKFKHGLDWDNGHDKKCLLVADMICMGTELRVAQQLLSTIGSNIVGCASIALYNHHDSVKCISLLDKNDMESIGYSISLDKKS